MTEGVEWDDLQAVFIDTTDTGPFAEDVFFVLAGEKGGCVVPQEAAGADSLLKRLGQLPGFDHDAVCRAMCCAENNRFFCWKREDAMNDDVE